MKVIRPEGIGQPVYVLPDTGRTPLAGPFATKEAARLWIVEKVEAGLPEAKRETWRRVSERLPGPTDMGMELGLIGFVAHGMTWEHIQKYLPHTYRPAADRKMLAAGEAA
jgi:hypothetical protein